MALLVAEIAVFAYLVTSASDRPEPAEPPALAVVSDRPAEPQVPLYMQTDERWAGLPYAEATIGESGCGLTCAAMAWSYLSNEVWTPVRLLNSVGNSNVQEGQNYMPGFCEWMVGQDPTLDCTVLYESQDRALEESADGRMVFASMTGQLHGSGQSYGGHIVLITGKGNGLVTINDPCEESEVQISVDDFQSVSWGYFISIGRSK